MKSLDYKFDFRDERNLSLVMDFYELTMSQCYFCLLYTSDAADE